jgi:hypothetical protein
VAEALASLEVAIALAEVVEAEKTDEAAKGALAEVADAEKTDEPNVEQDAVPHAFLHSEYMCKRR